MTDRPATAIDRLTEWLKARPAVLLGASMLLWLACVFVLRAGGIATLGWAMTLSAFISALMLGAVAAANHVASSETESLRRQRSRNIAIGLALGGLVVLFYVATLVRLGGNALNRPF